MHIIRASGDHPVGVIDALNTAPWYYHLAAAALLGGAAYGLRELDKRREEKEFDLLELVILIFAFAALVLACQGVFGNR